VWQIILVINLVQTEKQVSMTYTSQDFHYHQIIADIGYRSRGPGSINGTTRKKKVVGLERGPLSLVSTTEELLEK
jgi:hypothetical protein